MASTNMVEPVAIERFVGTPLPSGATSIRTNAESGIDTLTLLRFDAPTREATGFATRVLGSEPKAGYDPVIDHFGTGVEWWTPKLVDGASGGRADDRTNNRSYRIIVVPGQSGVATVWLVAFSS